MLSYFVGIVKEKRGNYYSFLQNVTVLLAKVMLQSRHYHMDAY